MNIVPSILDCLMWTNLVSIPVYRPTFKVNTQVIYLL